MHQDDNEARAQPEQEEQPAPTAPAPELAQASGYLVHKMRPGEGLQVGNLFIIRLVSSKPNRSDIAVRVPKGVLIRRLPAGEDPV